MWPSPESPARRPAQQSRERERAPLSRVEVEQSLDLPRFSGETSVVRAADRADAPLLLIRAEIRVRCQGNATAFFPASGRTETPLEPTFGKRFPSPNRSRRHPPISSFFSPWSFV